MQGEPETARLCFARQHRVKLKVINDFPEAIDGFVTSINGFAEAIDDFREAIIDFS
jgi:hypothetical protein